MAKLNRVIALRDQHRQQHNLYVAFDMTYESGEPIADGVEVDGAGFFSFEQMAEMPVAAMTRWLIDVAEGANGRGLTEDDTEFPYPGSHQLFRI